MSIGGPDDLDDLGGDVEEWSRQWAEVDEMAATLVRSAYSEVFAAEPPLALAEPGAREEWLEALMSTISPLDLHEDSDELESEALVAVSALEHADWIGLLHGLVGGGVGTRFAERVWVRGVTSSPLIESEGPVDDDDLAYALPVAVLEGQWRALHVLDEHGCLTEQGLWGLPRAVVRTWTDDGEPDPYAHLTAEEQDLVVRLLAEQPRGLDALHLELQARGSTVDREALRRALIWPIESWDMDDGTYVHVPSLIEGIVLTRRVTQEEVEHSVLVTDVDLAVFVCLEDQPLTLPSGEPVEARSARHDDDRLPDWCSSGLVGPDGWLRDHSPGDLLAVSYADRVVTVEALADEPARPEVVAALREVVADAIEAVLDDESTDGVGALAATVVLDLVRRHPGVLHQPAAPLSSMLEGTEVECHRGLVGRRGAYWHPVPLELDDHDYEVMLRWRRALAWAAAGRSLAGFGLGELAGSLGGLLLDLAAADMTHAPEIDGGAAAAPVLRQMSQEVSGARSAVPLLLTSALDEARGGGRAWLDSLERAWEADPGLDTVAGDLADLWSVAGRASDASRLYAVAGLGRESPEHEVLRPFLRPPDGEVSRNRPCPCGSGKKYKLCHARFAQHPLRARSGWLWLKLAVFARRLPHRGELLSWVDTLSGGTSSAAEIVEHALDDDRVVDLALFDGGLAARFTDVLGWLLPEDERELLGQWVGRPLQALRVQQVLRGRGVEARDAATGDVIVLLDLPLSRVLQAEDLVVCRPLPDGEGSLRLFSPPWVVPLPRQAEVERVVSSGASAREVAAALASGGSPESDRQART